MSTPESRRTFVDITLEEGSAVPAELADDRKITAQALQYTLPRVQRARVDVGAGGRAPYPTLGRLQPMSYSMQLVSVYAGLLAGIGNVYQFEIVENLDPQPASGRATLTHEITATLQDSDFGTTNLGADEVRGITYNYLVTKYKQTKSGVTQPIYDIDLDAEIYRQNGVDMF